MALSLRRREGEILVLITESGEYIEIEVSAMETSQVKLSLTAPSTTKIYRKELFDKIASEQVS